ncbi:tRNA (adenosine(37)-N6)-threonylcarbamoyltransferase complex dimerization subunit type 1 TsaB [Oscillatoria salina]|uniref:tRNA (adenosine(37)-N6)-threonylcarbamoyltransferase complex dimerization subunit type 1 TsaB n=1 Tax=Oscillatoria salina TaxID=331517 RepID=UPI0013BB74BA|nr:tRNA (adenosine(37)-N6)-threonylcarbamoyltransferase complex dimerization subunit type 1 TsaB [Oscillatoria salina]MBZ8182317.1 tRNA (adenosine(37)-N6)-threonylcarbamoyltransferase complex dimerization subunit type 1 TsaB [Oscillatoria salina IIICB1]NET89968.1 tRNA (adenosine(37)-N6)-threonylcarbamoyltransferase complex dimerization subunit type 1 TsaB [Kamptonema sp. SIO1D9]
MKKNHPQNYGLALHTTTGQLGLAISNFTGESRQQTWDLGRDVSTYLHQYLNEFIQPQTWRDLGFIAVGKGPGGFTGTRIGVVTARTLGQQLDIPVFGISTLAAAVWQEKDKLSSEIVAIQMQARRGQLFVAIYQISGDRPKDRWALPNRLNLIETLPNTTMTQEGWQQTLANLETNYQLIKEPTNLGNTSTALLELAYNQWQQGKRPHWSEALPFYGQNPVE